MNQLESSAKAEELVTVGVAEEADLVELARIAAFNFENSKNYQGLPRHVVARFIERCTRANRSSRG